MTLNYASLLHVLSLPSLLLNSSRLDRRPDNDLITSARRADVSLLARPTHACTCYCKFPGNQGSGQPVWSWAAATIFRTKHHVLINTMLNRHCACAMSRDVYPLCKNLSIYFNFSPPLCLFSMSLSLGSDEE